MQSFKGKQHFFLDGHWRTMNENQEFIQMEDEVITLKYNSNVDSGMKATIESSYHLQFLRVSDAGYIDYEVNPDSIFIIANALNVETNVAFVKTNYMFQLLTGNCLPNDYYYQNGYNAHLIKVKAPQMWEYMYCDNETKLENCNTIVAVIDNGIDITHPDLGMGSDGYENINKLSAENDWSNPVDPATGNNIDNGNNGFIDDWKGWDFTSSGNPIGDNNVEYDSGSGGEHGTLVAGIIAAKNFNNIGISSIAGGWYQKAGAQIMPINVDEGEKIKGSVIDNAIDYAKNNGAKVINMSFGVKLPSPDYQDIEDALKSANETGVICVAASGNHIFFNDMHVITYPASSKYTISVGLTNTDDSLHTISCYDPINSLKKRMDIVSPKADISTKDVQTYGQTSNGTSFSAPMVSATIANMLCYNPCLSNEMARDILHNTADKVTVQYNDPYTYPSGYNNQFGYGRLNAFEAVKKAKELYVSTEDLYMKDCPEDMGETGANYACINTTDASPDIWIRTQNDGLEIYEHEEPMFNQTNYVYVRVRNRSCTASTAGRHLKVYWSKAATWTSWPQNWDGTLPNLGNVISSVSLPSLSPGEVRIIEIPWVLPQQLNSNTYTPFCILARIDGNANDPTISNSVEECNHITIRNTVVFGTGDIVPGYLFNTKHFYPLGGFIDIVNADNAGTYFDFTYEIPPLNNGNIVTDVAEIAVIFDDESWNVFHESGSLEQEGVEIVKDKEIRITNSPIVFRNVFLPENVRYTTYMGLYFRVDSLNNNKNYAYRITQKYADSTWLLGGENIIIKKNERIPFKANAGPDKYVFSGDTATLVAAEINEPVIYEWYKGTALKHTGRIYGIVADTTATSYTLKVISENDASIDYDYVNVYMKAGSITAIYPNPASTDMTVNYTLNNVSNAQLLILHPIYMIVDNIALNTSSTNQSIDISSLPNATYTAVLVCDNKICDTKSFIKQ